MSSERTGGLSAGNRETMMLGFVDDFPADAIEEEYGRVGRGKVLGK